MRILETIIIDSKNPRLTITPTRLTLKIPKDTPIEEISVFQKKAQNISDVLGEITKSFRGKFTKDGNIRLSYGNEKTYEHTFIF